MQCYYVIVTVQMRACTKCGSLITPVLDKPVTTTTTSTRRWRCRSCGGVESVVKIRVPQVFAYMVAELASVNIATNLTVTQ